MSEGTDQPVVTDRIDPAGTGDDEAAVDRAGADDAPDTVDAVEGAGAGSLTDPSDGGR